MLGLWAVVMVLVSAGVLGGAPPAAEAQTVDAGRFSPVEGPRLAGDEVVWVPNITDRGFRVDARPLAGGPTRTIFEMLSTPDYGVVVNDLAASPQQVLVEQRLPEGFEDREVIRIGDDGTVEALGTGSINIERQIDLSGNVGIYNGSEPGATIRDFGTSWSLTVISTV